VNLQQWVSAASGTKMVNLSQVEAVVVTGSANPFTVSAVSGSNTYAIDGLSFTTSALAFAAIQKLLGQSNSATDPTVTTGNTHDV
jgi:hypothetical protein